MKEQEKDGLIEYIKDCPKNYEHEIEFLINFSRLMIRFRFKTDGFGGYKYYKLRLIQDLLKSL